MHRNLALEAVRVTEAAALSCARFLGRGDKVAADQAAVDAMRRAFDLLNIRGVVVIGEGERDEAPMLYIGEKVGRWASEDHEIDIALDPLEGTNLCAQGRPGALAVLAMASRGDLLHAPDTYMNKIAVAGYARDVISLKHSPTENLLALAKAKGVRVPELTVCILFRERHYDLIEEVRKSGARIILIDDGDVQACISAATPDSGIDIYLGTGGAPEGVLSAAALKCLGGHFEGQLQFRSDEEWERARKMGIETKDRYYGINGLARGDVMFAATGVTDSPLLDGVRYARGGGAKSHSLVMRSKTTTVRYLHTHHHFDSDPAFA